MQNDIQSRNIYIRIWIRVDTNGGKITAIGNEGTVILSSRQVASEDNLAQYFSNRFGKEYIDTDFGVYAVNGVPQKYFQYARSNTEVPTVDLISYSIRVTEKKLDPIDPDQRVEPSVREKALDAFMETMDKLAEWVEGGTPDPEELR